jgi:predicted membrane protein
MIIKTKKYQLPKNVYIKSALVALLMKQWWYAALPIAIAAMTFIWPSLWAWFIFPAFLLALGYILFWLIQFTGVSQMEQNKIMFERLSYEIDSRQIMIKLNERQGSPLKWDMIKSAQKNKDHFLLVIGKGQFIYLPFKIFAGEHEIKFLETILKRKEYIS